MELVQLIASLSSVRGDAIRKIAVGKCKLKDGEKKTSTDFDLVL